MSDFPLIIENFITDEENEILLNTITNHTQLFTADKSTDPRWDKRSAGIDRVHREGHESAWRILANIGLKIQNKIREIEKSQELFVEHPMYVRWLPGDDLDPPHADNIEPDGITPNKTPWRSHGAVLYINSDFTGGDFFYKDHDIEIIPKPKLLVLHRAGLEDMHGVREILSGTRYTVTCFATKDKTHEDKFLTSYLKSYNNFLENLKFSID